MNSYDKGLLIFFVIFGITFNFIFYKINDNNSPDNYLMVKVDGENYDTHELDENGIFIVEIDGRMNKFSIENGVVKMLDANCPDKECVHQGRIEHNLQLIVCLPNNVVLQIISDEVKEDSKTPYIDSVVQ